MDGRGRRTAIVAALLIGVAAASVGSMRPAQAQGQGGPFVAEDLAALVLGEEDTPEDAEFRGSDFLVLDDTLPERYEALLAAGVQAVYRSSFDFEDGSTLLTHAMLFADEAPASQAVALLNPAGPGDPIDLGDDALLWYQGDPVIQVGWRRGNVLLEVLYLGQEYLLVDAIELGETMDARALALVQDRAGPLEEGEAQQPVGTPGAGAEEESSPIMLIAVILLALVALALAIALFLLSRRRSLAAHEPPMPPRPADATAETQEARGPEPVGVAAPGEQMKYCRSCGTPHPMEARFCGSCGQQFG